MNPSCWELSLAHFTVNIYTASVLILVRTSFPVCAEKLSAVQRKNLENHSPVTSSANQFTDFPSDSTNKQSRSFQNVVKIAGPGPVKSNEAVRSIKKNYGFDASEITAELAKNLRAENIDSGDNRSGKIADNDDQVTQQGVDDKTGDSTKRTSDRDTHTFPPPLPTPDKFISRKDFEDLLRKSLEAAKTVANLVSTGLKNHAGKIKKSKPKEPPKRPSGPTEDGAKFKNDADPLFSNVLGFFNLIGVDKKSLSTIGINSLIVLVHLVVKNLLGEGATLKAPDKPPDGSMYSWIFQNNTAQFKEIIDQIQEPGVEERIIGLVRESSPLETDCVQLLLCRLAPIIWGMQKALTRPPPSDWASMRPVDRMYAYFPSFDQIVSHRPSCEIRFPNCRIKYRHLYRDLEEKLNQ